MKKYYRVVGGKQNKIENFLYKIILPTITVLVLIWFVKFYVGPFFDANPEVLNKNNGKNLDNLWIVLGFILIFSPMFLVYYFFEYKKMEIRDDIILFNNIWHRQKIYNKNNISKVVLSRDKVKGDIIKWIDIYFKENPKTSISFIINSHKKGQEIMNELKEKGYSVEDKSIYKEQII